jgi:hypothetical protein
MSTFDSTKRLLPDILGEIVKGKMQLPELYSLIGLANLVIAKKKLLAMASQGVGAP